MPANTGANKFAGAQRAREGGANGGSRPAAKAAPIPFKSGKNLDGAKLFISFFYRRYYCLTTTTRVAAASKRRGNDPRQIGSGCCRTEKICKGLAASLTPKKISCWFAAPREALFRRASIPMKARSPRHGASQRTRRALAAMLCYYCLLITIGKRETSMKDHINVWEVYLHSKRTSTNRN